MRRFILALIVVAVLFIIYLMITAPAGKPWVPAWLA